MVYETQSFLRLMTQLTYIVGVGWGKSTAHGSWGSVT